MTLLRLAAATVVLGPLCAQTVPAYISPLQATAALGNVNNSIPFASTPNSYQQVHSIGSFSNTAAVVFTVMTLRMASGFTNLPGQTIDVEIFMSQSPNDAISASTTYANNITPGTEVNVFTRKLTLLPQVPDNSWAVPFPFDNPFPFTGVHDLSWRASVYGNSNSNMRFTYQSDAWSGQGTNAVTPGTAGCQAANGTAAATHTIFAPSLKLGENLQLTGNSFVPTGGLPALLTIGASSTSFLGVPLPLDLTAAGAPGCLLANDILLLLSGVTNANANGSVLILVPLPIDLGLVGSRFYTQYLFYSPGANALGIFSSNGRSHTVNTPFGVSRIFSGLNAATGSRDRFFGLAVGFN